MAENTAQNTLTPDQNAFVEELSSVLEGHGDGAAQAAALQGLVELLGNGGTPDDEPEPEVPAHETLLEGKGGKFVKGRTYVTNEAVKALARVAKSGTPELVASPEGYGNHLLVFVSDQGNVAVQNVTL